MRTVAKNYNLPLRAIIGYPMPLRGMANRLGDCSHSGEIRLVLRCTVDGQWCEEPLSPDTIWDTAAHELAHLRHMNHGEDFQQFAEELQVAMNNRKVDHKQKVLDKLIKLQASRNSEADLGNEAAAEAFAGMINKMLIEYELNPSDIDYARATDNDPVIQISVNNTLYHIEATKSRVAWQESLASSIANAHLCKILIRPGSNDIFFVGTKSHVIVAEYVYGTMVPLISKMSKSAEIAYWKFTGCGRGRENKALGYRSAWIDAFITRIWERFAEARKAAVTEYVQSGGGTQEQGLIRLDGQLEKVRKFIEDKFSHRRAASRAGVLNYRSRNHTDGRAAGRSAADSITLGRRGLTGNSSNRKLIK